MAARNAIHLLTGCLPGTQIEGVRQMAKGTISKRSVDALRSITDAGQLGSLADDRELHVPVGRKAVDRVQRE